MNRPLSVASIVVLAAAFALAACGPSTRSKHWTYDRKEDQLRDRTITVAQLEWNENWADQPDQPQMILTITKGTVANDRLSLVNDSYSCREPMLFRMDDQPIVSVDRSITGKCLDLPLNSELAQKIMASSTLVAEIGGVDGPQLTFNTAGLAL